MPIRSYPPVHHHIPEALHPLVQYAFSIHPLQLDPDATALAIIDNRYHYTYFWDEYAITFSWDNEGTWVSVDPDTSIPGKTKDFWVWPLDPQDRVQMSYTLDTLVEAVLDSST